MVQHSLAVKGRLVAKQPVSTDVKDASREFRIVCIRENRISSFLKFIDIQLYELTVLIVAFDTS